MYLTKYIETSIISVVGGLKSQAVSQANLRDVEYEWTPKHAAKLLWEAHKTADTTKAAFLCGNLSAQYDLADTLGITLPKEILKLRKWVNVINPS